jgi:hypothetical protein
LFPAGSRPQSVAPKPLSPELYRPGLLTSKPSLTQNEQLLLEAVGKLNLEDKTTSVKVLSEFISEHPDVGTGYALRASEFGCETSEPNIEMAYADAKRSLEYPPDILNFGNLSTAIVAKASLRLNKPREAITLLTDAISRNLKNPNDLLQSKTGKIEQSEFSLCHWALESSSHTRCLLRFTCQSDR